MQEDDWIIRLRGVPAVRDAAIAELRAVLLRGLTRGLANRYGQVVAVEDIVQEALLKILASIDTFEGRSQFLTWAMTVATRVGISTLRRKYYQDVSLDAFNQQDSGRVELVVDKALTASGEQQRKELVEQLQQLINTELTEKQRVAVIAFLDGCSIDSIAEQTGANRNATYKLIHDARSRLKEGFNRLGVTATDVYKVLSNKAAV